MRILNSNRIAVRNKIYVYTNKQAVMLDGQLAWIPKVVSVEEINEDYRITLGNDWIEFVPASSTDKEALITAQVSKYHDPWHFGPRLNVALLGPNTLSYKITHSNGVHYDDKKDTLVFDRCPELGLSLGLWKKQFSTELSCDFVKGEVTLQLEAAKESLLSNEGSNILDLDPEIVIDHSVDSLATLIGGALFVGCPGIFAITRAISHPVGGTETLSYSNTMLQSNVHYRPSCGCTIKRAVIKFDTSGLETPKDARIRLHNASGLNNNARLVFDDNTYAAPSDLSNYSEVLVNYEGNAKHDATGGLGLSDGNTVAKSTDLVSLGEWAEVASLAFGVIERTHDAFNSEPVNSFIHGNTYDYNGADAPRLELTYEIPTLNDKRPISGNLHKGLINV